MNYKIYFSLFLIAITFFILVPFAEANIVGCIIPPPLPGIKLTVSKWISRRMLTVSNSSTISYECQDGFESTFGDTQGICINNRIKLHNSTTDFKPLVCRKKCEVPLFPNGRYRRVGNLINFQCDDGYFLRGSSVIRCSLNKKGKLILESCPPICEYPFCEDPGYSFNSIRNGSCCRVGDVLQYDCIEGFELEDKDVTKTEIICLETEEWNGRPPKCKPKDATTCKLPNLEESHLVIISKAHSFQNYSLDVYLSGTQIELSCEEGYENYRDEMQIGCFNGEWDKDFPVCQFRKPCIRPPQPVRGKIEELDSTDWEEFPIGFEINFICDEGYEIKNRHPWSICLGNNRWLGGNIPNCTIVSCGDPGIPKNGTRVGNSFVFGDQLTFACNDGFKLLGSRIRNCQPNGQWTGKRPFCEAYSKCGMRHPKSSNHARVRRVVGGRKVLQPWPWMVSLRLRESQHYEQHKCGGSIISDEWILAAASCFGYNENYLKVSNWRARIGMVETIAKNITIIRHSLVVLISKIILHEDYNPDDRNFDIALIQMKTPLQFGESLRPICLPPQYEDLPQNSSLYQPQQKATVFGWGSDKPFNPSDTGVRFSYVADAQELDLPLQAKDKCGPAVKWRQCIYKRNCRLQQIQVTENMLCAGDAQGIQDTCVGDGGGPLMQEIEFETDRGIDKRWIEIGIVSWGVGCSMKGYYSYYTNVAKLRDWIENTTGETFENVYD